MGTFWRKNPNPVCSSCSCYITVFIFVQIYIFPCWSKGMLLIAAIIAFHFCVFSVITIAPDTFFCQWYTSHSVGDACSLYFASFILYALPFCAFFLSCLLYLCALQADSSHTCSSSYLEESVTPELGHNSFRWCWFKTLQQSFWWLKPKK